MASPVTLDSFLQWDPAQVASFINSVVPDDGRSVGLAFLDNNIEGSLLPFLTTEHLRELGILKLHTRLTIKRAINDLICQHYSKNPPQSLNDPEYKLNNININNNHISLESLQLSTVLIKDMIKKVGVFAKQQALSEMSSPGSPGQIEMKKLHDNFNKLKTDLIPVIRLLKDSKPLPTPVLDSPTTSYMSSNSDHDDSTLSNSNANTLALRNVAALNTVANRNSNATNLTNLPSPTYSKRFSSGSILSLGTGKVVQQAVPKLEPRLNNDFHLQTIPQSLSNRSISESHVETFASSQARPRLVETKSSGATPTTANASKAIGNGSVPGATVLKPTLKSYGSNQQIGQQPKPSSAPAANEPLKQLRASTDDSCLKILQQAMKRHHIPRDDWSKYVLVICYGDKERILKLGEKPVVVFKELQELGKHPAIMLRQLAPTVEDDNNIEYVDSRIGDDIPGGTL
ncbi:predicted protein [Scheffersomyces stipitis CBS 6054]|uniref:Ste50p n=1 Tax=Scheffersomyces stipitis (strain ATCC 58785 / CBS 6054 / NBRC 10063 / NRRL Y-11545) TaxID=322104 RepID=A3GHA9_PICST|nr:predicted protein [Scheffersomyces stipitis CBS 6054]EAZ62784.2 predicted protein [Scheffersomyces stipitis CBS 6054]KAG2735256.1 hypothetical protein G9P44_001470 [Scheffersomyces stipitis]